MSRDWDAATYHRVSGPHVEWAGALLDRLELRGDETVLDAGCGSGRVTLMLLERLPHGRVIAVDQAPSMVEHAREALGERATVFAADLLRLTLDEPVDAVFSNAVFHWIRDHDRLFERLHAALRPGGRLVAQCGGGRAALRRAPGRLGGSLELRRCRADGRAARTGRLRGGRDVARALPGRAGRRHRLPAHRLPRLPPRAASRAAPRRLRRGRSQAILRRT